MTLIQNASRKEASLGAKTRKGDRIVLSEVLYELRRQLGPFLEEFWEKAVRRRVGKRARCVTARLPFCKLCFRPLFLNEWSMALGLWEPPVRQTLRLSLIRGSIFIDVGAHIGYHAVYAAKIVGKTGKVICVEPDPFNIPVLTRNISSFQHSRIIEAAASENLGFVPLSCSENPLYSESHKRSDESIVVPAITLDSLFEELKLESEARVLVKIDVEGSELRVLRGGMCMLRRYFPVLVMEIYPHNLSEVKKLLQVLGYRSAHMFGEYYLFVHPYQTVCR